MAEFIHSVMVPNESVTAGDIKTHDLPVNAMSHVLLTVKFAQNLANTQALFVNIMALITKIEVLYKGSSEFTLSGFDAYASAKLLLNFESWGVNAGGADNELRSFTWLIPFGRKLFNPIECYPASKRGELKLQTTFAAAFTNIDGVSYQVETIELPDANPERYLRQTTLGKTPTATGEDEIDLPIGNRISDLILFGTTVPAAATATRTIEYAKIQVDNQERYYSRSNFESLHNMAGMVGVMPSVWGNHFHQQDAAAFAQYQDNSVAKAGSHPLAQYMRMPFDFDMSGNYALETQGLSDLEIIISFGDTNAARVIPCELVEASLRRS